MKVELRIIGASHTPMSNRAALPDAAREFLLNGTHAGLVSTAPRRLHGLVDGELFDPA
jgi:hypothetical protein